MSEKYFVVKLAPQVSAWCDKENNIYLSRPNKVSKRLKEGCDMKMINKGVKAGLIFLEEHVKEQPVKPEVKKEVKPEPVVVPEPEVKEEFIPAPVRRSRKKDKEVEEVKVEVNTIEDKEE